VKLRGFVFGIYDETRCATPIRISQMVNTLPLTGADGRTMADAAE